LGSRSSVGGRGWGGHQLHASSARHEREGARVKASLDGQQAQRFEHFRLGDTHDSPRAGKRVHAQLLRQREEGVTRTLACLTVETDDADPHGNEPVRAAGSPIGYVSAGGYGHAVEQSIALAYLPVAHAEPGTRLTVDILGEPRPAAVVPQPIYDPENLRLLS